MLMLRSLWKSREAYGRVEEEGMLALLAIDGLMCQSINLFLYPWIHFLVKLDGDTVARRCNASHRDQRDPPAVGPDRRPCLRQDGVVDQVGCFPCRYYLLYKNDMDHF